MEAIDTGNGTEVTFTPEDWERHTVTLWDLADQTCAEEEALRERLASIDEERTGESANPSNLFQSQERRQELEAAYWKVFADLQANLDHGEHLLAVLEGIEEGTTTPQQVLDLLPPAEDEAEDTQPSRAKLAKQRKQLVLDELATFGLATLVVGDISPTDPRRIASGRNRTKLTKPTSAFLAEGAFIDVTADTHGGKSRRPGKSGHSYVGRGGKRIRKR